MWQFANSLLKTVFILYLTFALLSNILPFCRTVRIRDQTKRRLNRVDFCGSAENGPDRITLLESPTRALEARLAVLRDAQSTIDITYYKAVSDGAVDAVLGELLLAADRGVRVRILLDGRVGLSDRGIRKRLGLLSAHPNIAYRRYNPIHPLRPWQWQAALHDKFIVVDNAWLLLGGRNLGNRYFAPHGYTGAVTNDRDVLVWRGNPQAGEMDGSVLHQVAAHMDELWECTHTVEPAGKNPDGMGRQREDLLAAAARFERCNPQFYTQTIQDYGSQTVPTRKITLLTTPLHTGKKEPELAYQMRRLAMMAKESIIAQTPYSTANAHLLKAMEAVSGRVSRAVMLTNSLASSPNYPAYTNYYIHRDKFARTRVCIYEYQSTDSIHGKSMLVDGHISAVGSFNLDDRSIYIDTESMLVIDSGEFAQVLLDAMEAIRTQSLLVDKSGQEYAPGQKLKPVPAGSGKQIITAVVSPFSRLFRFLL